MTGECLVVVVTGLVCSVSWGVVVGKVVGRVGLAVKPTSSDKRRLLLVAEPATSNIWLVSESDPESLPSEVEEGVDEVLLSSPSSVSIG
jgi:hypothetical protein